MRTFIAVDFPSEFVEEVASLARSLERQVKGRFMPRENYHLTLAFLGEVDEADTRRIMDAMDAACAGISPLELTCTGLGTFGKKHNATLWLGLDEGVRSGADEEPELKPNLTGLAANLREELLTHSIAFDDKPFRPHITLARHADVSRGDLAALPFPAGCTATEVVLFKSILDRTGATYKPLYTLELKGS